MRVFDVPPVREFMTREEENAQYELFHQNRVWKLGSLEASIAGALQLSGLLLLCCAAIALTL